MKSYHINNSLVCLNNLEITDDSRARQNIICYTAKIQLTSTSSDATMGSQSESGAAEGPLTGSEVLSLTANRSMNRGWSTNKNETFNRYNNTSLS